MKLLSGSSWLPRRLRFESLEARRLLAITVNVLTDELDGSIVDGDVSLRDAIAAAAGGETIDFAVTGVIQLTQGQLAIGKDLAIRGPGANLLTIDASGNDPTPDINNGDGSRVFQIGDGNANSQLSVALVGLTIRGGDNAAVGGGIRNENEIVTVTRSTIRDNAGTEGGGLFTDVEGELALVNSTVSGNAAVQDGGGIHSNRGRVSLTGSVAADNTAGNDGGAVFAYYGQLTVSDSTISGNSANVVGGGLYSAFGNFSVARSVVSGNDAGYGGGIYNYSEATISATTIDGNSAVEHGGGVYTRGNLTLTDCTISGNSATLGGGMLSYTAYEERSTTVVGTTISGNTATQFGGGFYNYFGVSVIRHSTITKNTAPVGGGGGVDIYAESTTRTEVQSSIIAGNNGSDVDFVSGTFNSFQSEGYNCIGLGIAIGEFVELGDQAGVVDPKLEPLADNGGLTQTHALLADSPAVDAGDPAATAGVGIVPLFDQRESPFVRVFNGDGRGGRSDRHWSFGIHSR